MGTRMPAMQNAVGHSPHMATRHSTVKHIRPLVTACTGPRKGHHTNLSILHPRAQGHEEIAKTISARHGLVSISIIYAGVMHTLLYVSSINEPILEPVHALPGFTCTTGGSWW